ncbi:response regulator [Allomesorhizobium alhagi]|uniref:Response regulator receiver n=1 Tax=Mesorhizobium alhagi CCNWXJ12-2 TaxID=1107882 RepID=H0I2R0_9HYPH|nr:response regulator [Mesorhizobium alhagi]EHK52759.1 response regulator receiver [Mesorhizobium alhagi CCNWXJ12-2]
MSDEHDHSSETILVVDGDVIARTVISDYLRHCGYRVIEANSGEEALQALQHEKFNVNAVLSDVELPGELSGFDLAQWMRQNRPGIPIVLSSAVERAAQLAGDLCEQGPALAKPYEPKAVIDHIKRLKGKQVPD